MRRRFKAGPDPGGDSRVRNDALEALLRELARGGTEEVLLNTLVVSEASFGRGIDVPQLKVLAFGDLPGFTDYNTRVAAVPALAAAAPFAQVPKVDPIEPCSLERARTLEDKFRQIIGRVGRIDNNLRKRQSSLVVHVVKEGTGELAYIKQVCLFSLGSTGDCFVCPREKGFQSH